MMGMDALLFGNRKLRGLGDRELAHDRNSTGTSGKACETSHAVRLLLFYVSQVVDAVLMAESPLNVRKQAGTWGCHSESSVY